MYRQRTYRRARRTVRVPRALPGATGQLVLRRMSDPSTVALTGGFYGGTAGITLSQVVTSDLQAVFERYRIISATAVFTKQFDPGNSSAAAGTNTQLTICCACDWEGNATNPTALSDVGSFANAKIGTLTAGRSFSYTFYPRAVNTIDNGGTATAVGTYASNPWILCNSQGVVIPHQRLRVAIDSTSGTDASIVDVYYVIRFAVSGIN